MLLCCSHMSQKASQKQCQQRFALIKLRISEADLTVSTRFVLFLHLVEIKQYTTISYLSCNSQNYHPRGAVDDPMHCCPRPSASGNSASGHPQHLVGDSFDCCTERYEIVVLLPNTKDTCYWKYFLKFE